MGWFSGGQFWERIRSRPGPMPSDCGVIGWEQEKSRGRDVQLGVRDSAAVVVVSKSLSGCLEGVANPAVELEFPGGFVTTLLDSQAVKPRVAARYGKHLSFLTGTA